MRLIDADVLLKKLSDNSWNIDEWELPRKEVSAGLIANGMDRKTVEEMPTVDAVPVRHGKWMPENRTMDAYWVCSCCGFPSEAHGAFKIYKFCPNCGARMDEE